MSWEVLTMRSVTSFFNPALARSDLRRHWPILFLYTAIWLVALPVQLYLRHIAEGASYGTRTVSEVCQGTTAWVSSWPFCSAVCWPWPCIPT